MTERSVKRYMILGLLAFTADTATASIPVGTGHGPWHVTSISSISGGAGDDAAVRLSQETESGELLVSWTQGGPIFVSVDIKRCHGDDAFERSYSVDADRWLTTPRSELVRHLKSDISAWQLLARSSCTRGTRAGAFKLTELKEAVNDFTNSLASFNRH
jgi:hypothetical protein